VNEATFGFGTLSKNIKAAESHFKKKEYMKALSILEDVEWDLKVLIKNLNKKVI